MAETLSIGLWGMLCSLAGQHSWPVHIGIHQLDFMGAANGQLLPHLCGPGVWQLLNTHLGEWMVD